MAKRRSKVRREIPELDAIVATGARALAPGGRLIVEHRRRRATPEAVPGAVRTRVLEAGDSALSFYTAQEEA